MIRFTHAQYYLVEFLNRFGSQHQIIHQICARSLNFNIEKVSVNRKVKLLEKYLTKMLLRVTSQGD